jgi:hypothetical protein
MLSDQTTSRFRVIASAPRNGYLLTPPVPDNPDGR